VLAQRIVDEGLVIPAAHLVNPFPEMIEDFVVQPDGDPGLAWLSRDNCATFALTEVVFAFHKQCSYSARSCLVARRAEMILDKLAGGGYLDVSVERVGGAGACRPSKRYRAADWGRRLQLPSRRHDSRITLPGRAFAMLSTHEALAMAEAYGAKGNKREAAAFLTDYEKRGGHDPAGAGIHAQVQHAPRPACGRPMPL